MKNNTLRAIIILTLVAYSLFLGLTLPALLKQEAGGSFLFGITLLQIGIYIYGAFWHFQRWNSDEPALEKQQGIFFLFLVSIGTLFYALFWFFYLRG